MDVDLSSWYDRHVSEDRFLPCSVCVCVCVCRWVLEGRKWWYWWGAGRQRAEKRKE